VLLTVGLGFLVFYIIFALTHVSTDDAFIEAHVIPISPKVASHVSKVLVDDNQEVKDGELLVELDARDYEAKLLMTKASLESAEAERAQAAQDVERYKKLAENDEVSKQQLDKALLRLQTAQAQVAKTSADNEQASLQLSYTRISTPARGQVTRKNVEQGAYLQVGQAIMAIVSPERWVIANFKETQLTHMRPGQKVNIRVDAFPNMHYKGIVDSIQRGTGARFSLLPAENATGNYIKVVQRVPVKIVLDAGSKTDTRLVPGMSVDAVVNISS